MQTLPRTRPNSFNDLVVEVAIIRPGPIQGNAVHPYINRKQGREPVTYPHPLLERVLKDTLGVILYQEQIIEIAMTVGGMTPSGADGFRRAMTRHLNHVEMSSLEGGVHRGLPGQRRLARGRGPAVRSGAGLRGVRLLPLARRRVCPHRVRDGVAQAQPPCRVRLRPAQQPADGLLPPERAGRGPEAPWRQGAAGRRQPLRRPLPAGANRNRQRPPRRHPIAGPTLLPAAFPPPTCTTTAQRYGDFANAWNPAC